MTLARTHMTRIPDDFMISTFKLFSRKIKRDVSVRDPQILQRRHLVCIPAGASQRHGDDWRTLSVTRVVHRSTHSLSEAGGDISVVVVLFREKCILFFQRHTLKHLQMK